MGLLVAALDLVCWSTFALLLSLFVINSFPGSVPGGWLAKGTLYLHVTTSRYFNRHHVLSWFIVPQGFTNFFSLSPNTRKNKACDKRSHSTLCYSENKHSQYIIVMIRIVQTE